MAGKTVRYGKTNAWNMASPNDAERDSPLAEAPDRRARVAELAYFKAQRRGFEPGREIEDWLEAETEVER